VAYALERPQRVQRLILVGTGSGGPAYMHAPGALWNRSHPRFWHMAALAILHIIWPRLAPEQMLNNFIRRHSFYAQAQAVLKAVTLGDWFRPRRGRSDWHRLARHLDYAPRLGEIAIPVLVLCGRYDPQYPVACSEELAKGIENVQTIYFEHSGHYPFLEEHATFWAAMGQFLSQS
jgi:proline iminopeptidase